MKRMILVLGIVIVVLFFSACGRKGDVKGATEAIKKGKYSEAIKSLKYALTNDSLNPEIHFNLCLAYCYLDSADKAYPHFLKIVELNSPLKDSMELKLLLTKFLKMDPYSSSPIPMGKMNQFKGCFAPDNEMLAVAAAKRDIADIYLMKLDGTIVKRITNRGMNTDPAFSPKGDKIAYVSSMDGDEEIYLYDIKTDSTIKLTNNDYTDFAPAFSPDGKEIVYVTNRDGGWEIYKINLMQKQAFRLTKNKFWDGFPSYTPDGKFIVFSSKRNGSEDIYIMKPDGGDERLLYYTKYDETDPHLAGNNLFFRSNIDGEFEIYKFDIKEKILTRLTYDDVPDWNPRVSSDAQRIVIAKKTKKLWQLCFINLSSPVPAEVIAQRIKEVLAIPD
ncbi:MAG: DPP IV N-terminal domain-containing protein [candidate division WOR-3 bacterium]